MCLTKLLLAASTALSFMAIVILTVSLPATAAPEVTPTTIKLGKTVPMLDSGQALSYVGVPVSITCSSGNGSTQFNLFVTQSPNVSGSFGTITAQCSGQTENFVVEVQSNFGSQYHEGKAVASANCYFPCTETSTRQVTIVRLVNILSPIANYPLFDDNN